MKTDKIFNPQPKQWGLRGDSYLWIELENIFRNMEEPQTVEEFEKKLINKIENIIDESLTLETKVYVEKFAFGGMSSGYIGGEFWLNRGIPLLVKRFK